MQSRERGEQENFEGMRRNPSHPCNANFRENVNNFRRGVATGVYGYIYPQSQSK